MMRVPAFFDDVPDIVVADPLAGMLGAVQHGRIAYRYVDAVKLAGHSCPTVAGAWLLADRTLTHLYPPSAGRLPQRGGLRVELRRQRVDGSAGVVGAVLGLVTGAAGEEGFKGLGGRHARSNLLCFGAPIEADVRVTRLDTGAAIGARFHGERVPMPNALKPLLAFATMPDADVATLAEFGRSWQAWVKTILIEHRDDPALIELMDVPAPTSAPDGAEAAGG